MCRYAPIASGKREQRRASQSSAGCAGNYKIHTNTHTHTHIYMYAHYILCKKSFSFAYAVFYDLFGSRKSQKKSDVFRRSYADIVGGFPAVRFTATGKF